MAKDVFHACVREALEKDGWSITHDPYTIKVGEIPMEIDLGAERLIAAERGTDIIAVEIKSFIGRSPVHDFHEAIGQFGNYRSALRFKEPERLLFLAIPEEVFLNFFQRPFVQIRLEEENIKLLVFDPYLNIISTWIR
ncbi:MAG: XisH family protein [Bacteroidota bacterium]